MATIENFKTIILDFDKTLIDTSVTQPLRNQQSKNWDKIYEMIPQCKLYGGIPELMAFLKNNNIKTGVATFAQREFADRTLKHFNVDVDTIVGHERFMKKKPNPDSILKVMKKLNSEPTETIGIGDKSTDIHAYKSANLAITVGCTWGLSTEKEIEELKNSNPDYIIHHPKELIEITNLIK